MEIQNIKDILFILGGLHFALISFMIRCPKDFKNTVMFKILPLFFSILMIIGSISDYFK